MVGYDTSDDACVYKVSDDMAMICTVDFFPPMVDDPYVFGQIAAANALSDVWAMGGKPTLAMNLLCFPNCLDTEVASEILGGGANKCIEAGCTIAGGHTIADDEPKYGLSVTGFGSPDKILANSTARVGDVLVLTKPVGTGVLTTAFKGEILDDEALYTQMIDTMRTLNKYAAEAAADLCVHACTDITGFGLAGHTCEMAEGSGMSCVLHTDAVPYLDEAIEMARMGLLPAGGYRNRAFFGKRIQIADEVEEAVADVLFDPQTSGGLLFALPEDAANVLVERLGGASGTARVIGEVRESDGVSVRLVR